MARPSEAHVGVARRLLAQSCAEGSGPENPAAAVARAYDILFESLAPVIGAAGFQALFARSLKLAGADYVSLQAIGAAGGPSNKEDSGVIAQVVSGLSKLDPPGAMELATGLFAAFYALLTRFIGESLVQQIVKGTFPTVDEPGPEVRE